MLDLPSAHTEGTGPVAVRRGDGMVRLGCRVSGEPHLSRATVANLLLLDACHIRRASTLRSKVA